MHGSDDVPERGLNDRPAGITEGDLVRAGCPLPMGTHARSGGVNFSIFSRYATSVRLELFDAANHSQPSRVIDLTAPLHRTGDVWHVWIAGLASGQLYGYRIDGPYAPSRGFRFNPNRLLLDPLAAAVSSLPPWDFASARGYDPAASEQEPTPWGADNAASSPKCIVLSDSYDWGDDQPLHHPWSRTIIYEMHVRGFTAHPQSGVDHPGTYRGLQEKISYLADLGVTAVELMPVQEFNSGPLPKSDPSGEPLNNYWGYDPVVSCAPKASYSSAGGLGQQKREFQEMVRAFHRAGIEVILDMVFNHTAEGGELGPTLCFRGIDNSIYYALADDKRHYRDYTGTGNTVNANHPVVQDHILAALRYWRIDMHVDGFRFDLASVLGRDRNGSLVADAPLLERIAEDPILRDIKIIAEAWDAAGAYQVGSFCECRWAEWNGRYRDDVRLFWRGDEGMLGAFASRICGSADIYGSSGKGPESSINFVTCHDGFTLNDLVSYEHKHNERNGEANQDGSNADFSDNCGAEGATADFGVENLRKRQIKNFLLTLLLSRGVPMLLGGDEVRRTQGGNNNAYCQDNATSWFNWAELEANRDIHRFACDIIAFRKAHPVLSKEEFYAETDIEWVGPAGGLPGWADAAEKRLGCLIKEDGDPALLMMFNAGTENTDFMFPTSFPRSNWRLAFDTAQEPSKHADPATHHVLRSRASAIWERIRP